MKITGTEIKNLIFEMALKGEYDNDFANDFYNRISADELLLKAFLDRDTEMMRTNECRMILEAFDTFMKLKENPDKYVDMMTGESGSDYDGKF